MTFSSFFARCKIIKNRQLSKFKVNFSLIYGHNVIKSVSTKLSGGVKANCRRNVVWYFRWLLDIFAFAILQPHHTYMHHRVSCEPKQNPTIHNTLYVHIVEMKILSDAISYVLTAHTVTHIRVYLKRCWLKNEINDIAM